MENKRILDSWKEICAYLKRSEKTCRKWEQELGLPIHRIGESPHARVFAYKNEIDRWMEKTQHSERKTFFGISSLNKFNIAAFVIIVLAIIAIIFWRPWSKAVPTLDPSVKASIAVLPFTDLSREKDQAYFCEGMADSIINALSNISELRIPACGSSFSFKDNERDIQEIGEMLNVKSVLQGSVQKTGNRLRITAQLINVNDKSLLWSEQYDRELGDVFTIQDEITLAVVDKLRLELLKEEKARLMKRYTENHEAYNMYLKGRFFWSKRPQEVYVKKGIEYFQRVIEKDPTYALAYTGLADSYVFLGQWNFLSPKDSFPKARALIEKALEIDEMLAEAHTTLAFINTYYDWDWTAAEREFKRALELNPNYATAHHWYSGYLMAVERFDESVAEAKRALELDPLSLHINSSLGGALLWASQFDTAIEQFRKTLEMNPNYLLSLVFLGRAYSLKGMEKEAIEVIQKAVPLAGEFPFALGLIGYEYALLGHSEEAVKILNRLDKLSKERYVSPLSHSLICAGLADWDQSLMYLEKALMDREPKLAHVKSAPWSTLRSNSKCEAMMKKMISAN